MHRERTPDDEEFAHPVPARPEKPAAFEWRVQREQVGLVGRSVTVQKRVLRKFLPRARAEIAGKATPDMRGEQIVLAEEEVAVRAGRPHDHLVAAGVREHMIQGDAGLPVPKASFVAGRRHQAIALVQQLPDEASGRLVPDVIENALLLQEAFVDRHMLVDDQPAAAYATASCADSKDATCECVASSASSAERTASHSPSPRSTDQQPGSSRPTRKRAPPSPAKSRNPARPDERPGAFRVEPPNEFVLVLRNLWERFRGHYESSGVPWRQ